MDKQNLSHKASVQRLKFCNFKLDSLLDITQAINNNLSNDGLLNKYERLLRNELNIGKVIVFAYNASWTVFFKSGCIESDYKDIVVERDLLKLTEITTTLSLHNKNFRVFDVVIPVFNNEKALAYVLIGDFEEEKEGISPTIKHLHFIQTLTNVIFVAIENKRLFKENLKQERLKKELEMASKMQEMLIPKSETLPKNKYFAIEAFYFPHFEVGGDYYDFEILSEKELFFCIADVSGKGMSAALLMSNFQANLKALLSSEISLTTLINKLNYRVNQNANGEKFITFFAAIYNCHTKVLRYINAGHNPPLLFNSIDGKLNYLTQGCLGIGMIDDIPVIIEGEVKIFKDAKLLCFTDGLVELERDDQIESSQTILENCLATSNKSIKQTINDLIIELNVNKSNTTIFDDITMLGIEFF